MSACFFKIPPIPITTGHCWTNKPKTTIIIIMIENYYYFIIKLSIIIIKRKMNTDTHPGI